MNPANPATLRAQKGSQLPNGESLKTVNHIKLNGELPWLIIPAVLLLVVLYGAACKLAELPGKTFQAAWHLAD
jgi:hypothetical protein